MISFWDSSALVPLCAHQQNSVAARRLSRLSQEKAVWRECVVEVSSAFARLQREGLIDAVKRRRYEVRLEFLESELTAVGQPEQIIKIARTFPSLYDLKALDSLQLAAALVWCKEYPRNKDFIAADLRLLKAAESVGFTVHDLS